MCSLGSLRLLSSQLRIEPIWVLLVFITSNITHPLFIAVDIRTFVHQTSTYNHEFIRSVWSLMWYHSQPYIQLRYYPKFLRSSQFCEYQLELIASGKLILLDILLGDNALFHFMEVGWSSQHSKRYQWSISASLNVSHFVTVQCKYAMQRCHVIYVW